MSLSSTISPIWNTFVSVSAGSAWLSPGRRLSQAASLVGVESFSGVELLGPVLSWIYYWRRKYYSDGIITTFHLQLHILASILLLFTCNIRLQTDEAVWPGPVMPSVQCVPATWLHHLKLWESLPPVTKARTCSWLAISSRLQRCFSSSWSWYTIMVSSD